MGNSYCFNGAERDFLVTAHRAADVTGETQVVHMHAFAVSCDGWNHVVVEPKVARARAVGGLELRLVSRK